jgi:hypothetical protein
MRSRGRLNAKTTANHAGDTSRARSKAEQQTQRIDVEDETKRADGINGEDLTSQAHGRRQRDKPEGQAAPARGMIDDGAGDTPGKEAHRRQEHQEAIRVIRRIAPGRDEPSDRIDRQDQSGRSDEAVGRMRPRETD